MASKKKAAQPPVRRSVLVMGGAAIGAALFGFVLFTFVLGGGGGGGTEATTAELATLNNASIPIAAAAGAAPGSDGLVRNELTPGGRDPFLTPAGVQTEPGGPSSSTGTTSAPVAAAPAPEPVYVPPPAPAQTVPVGEGPPPATQPAPPPPAPQPTPRPVYPTQTISVLGVAKGSADIRIDDVVYEDVRARQVLTERFNLDEFDGACFWMKDRYPKDSRSPERFKLCAGDTVTR